MHILYHSAGVPYFSMWIRVTIWCPFIPACRAPFSIVCRTGVLTIICLNFLLSENEFSGPSFVKSNSAGPVSVSSHCRLEQGSECAPHTPEGRGDPGSRAVKAMRRKERLGGKKCWPEQQGLVLQRLPAELRWLSAVASRSLAQDRRWRAAEGRSQGLGGSPVASRVRHTAISIGHHWGNKEGNEICGKMDPRRIRLGSEREEERENTGWETWYKHQTSVVWGHRKTTQIS